VSQVILLLKLLLTDEIYKGRFMSVRIGIVS